jgi:hypothetical protein
MIITPSEDSVYRPKFQKNGKQRFGSWVCFLLQVKGQIPTLLGLLEIVVFLFDLAWCLMFDVVFGCPLTEVRSF